MLQKLLNNHSDYVAADADEKYQNAFNAARQGRSGEVQQLLIHLLLESPGHSFSRSDLGVLLFNQGQRELGVCFMESAYRLRPDFIPFAKNLAKSYLALNRVNLATPLLQELLRTCGSDMEVAAMCNSCGLSQAANQNPQSFEAESVTPAENRGKIALFYDRPDWAWWHRCQNIKRGLAGQFEIDLLQLGHYFDHRKYDLCLVFDHCVLHLLPPIPSEKLIVGNSCPKMLTDFIECVQERGCAGVVNNKFGYETALKKIAPVFLCQNGVDIDFFYPSPKIPEIFAACWVGNSGSMGNKGLDLIQEACRQAGVELIYVDARKILEGESNNAVASQQQIRDEIYHRASVYICASEFEGTPNPALEALACGLGVISTNVGNMPEILIEGWNGCIVERSVQGIATGLRTMRTIDRSELRMRSRVSIVHGWDWRAQSLKYGTMFKDLLAKKEIQPTVALGAQPVKSEQFGLSQQSTR